MKINLEQHKIYIETLKMEMVPLSVAIQAVEQATNVNTEKYEKDLEFAIAELHKALNNIKIDD